MNLKKNTCETRSCSTVKQAYYEEPRMGDFASLKRNSLYLSSTQHVNENEYDLTVSVNSL